MQSEEIISTVPSKPQSVTLDDERTYPETEDRPTFQHHMARYLFALPFIEKQQDVLETGCGVGYGTHMICQKAHLVVGVDYSLKALEYARNHYTQENLAWARMDCHSLAFPSARFDWVISFEMFEHVQDPDQYLSECRRMLRQGGRLMLSTPNRAAWEIHMRSIGQTYDYHISMMDLNQLRTCLRRHFSTVTMYGQRRRGNRLYSILRALDIWNFRLRLVRPSSRESMQKKLGVPVEAESLKPEDWVFVRSQLRQCNHFLAICQS